MSAILIVEGNRNDMKLARDVTDSYYCLVA
jgi:hypothetical protein